MLMHGAVATQALRRKKALEQELDRLSGQRLQIEMHVNTLESANLNAETMAAMKKGADALKTIHKGMCVLIPLPLPCASCRPALWLPNSVCIYAGFCSTCCSGVILSPLSSLWVA
jgi:hypothetical protein